MTVGNQAQPKYSIDVAGDGEVTLVLGPEVGLSQDFLLDLVGQVQNQRAEALAHQRTNHQAKPAESPDAAAARAKVPVQPRWWPPEVRCPHCGRTTKLAKEPDCYAVLCPGCGEVVVVDPISA